MLVVSAEIAAELAKAHDIPDVAVACLAALAAAEARSFRSLYGDSAAHPRLWEGSLDRFPPEEATRAVGPDGRPTHPFGAWQWEPATAGDIAIGLGSTSVDPQHQIAGSWWLAQRDYKARTRGENLETALLNAGRNTSLLTDIAGRLYATWPGGANAGFPARHIAALDLFDNQTPAPAPLPSPDTSPLVLRPGMFIRFPLLGVDQDNRPYVPDDALVSDDLSVCCVEVQNSLATITGIAAGRTLVHGADLVLAVLVEQRRLVHLSADLSKAVRGMALAGVVAMAMALLPMGLPVIAPPAPLVYFAPADLFNPPAEMVITIVPELPAITSPALVPCLVGVGRRGVRVGSPEECGGSR